MLWWQVLIGLLVFAIFCSLLYLYLSWAVEEDEEDISAVASGADTGAAGADAAKGR